MAEEKRHYLRQVEHFCARVQNDWYRVYLVRKLTSQQGMKFVQSLSRQGHPAHWVFPRGVIAQQKDHTGQMDQYLVHGDSYKALRDAVGKAILECKPLAIETALEQCEAMEKFIGERKTLSPDIRRFAISLVNNELPLLRMDPGDNSLEGTVIEMAIHVATILLCGQSKVLEPLKNLAFSPDLMACGLPMEQSFCIDCGTPVGGIDHKPKDGFHVIEYVRFYLLSE
ncbi:E3 ubiquitin-protein ligase [Pontoporia blainvillei]|uniref:E3 ubiquitin-protein ligase n=1 Tax=Pontoporia blainvillei TaxID=48723 RepID=A0ABX0SB50_PONBL|nr:E3 ubiquitin-protein ligase [Pontoporia blainvillei]